MRGTLKRGWPDADCTMCQCVLTGKAQEGYSALSVTDAVYFLSLVHSF